jgi:predicted P-loop ATPase
MLFLQGASGCGKTFFLTQMFTINGENYILNKIDPNGKDNEIGPLIAKNWLIQFGESESLKKVSVQAAKEFMDRINLGMKYQKKYENEQTTIYPRIMACRTSNDDVLFNDVSINDGDRRNWLIVCRTGINSCDEKLRALINKEKDILWATAYKLYLDNPDQDLELTNEAFNQLAAAQEEYKLIKNDDVEEVFEEVMNREYLTNGKGFIQDEASFNKMLEKSDVALHTDTVYVAALIDDHSYCQVNKVSRIPARWLNNYIQRKYGVNFLKVFKDHLKKMHYIVKSCGYNNKTMKCWEKS